jgi:hypothetical protein
VGYNVVYDNPIFGIPFGFWTPYYVYYVGKRDVTLLAPVIGQNKVEGWFAKNTVDYYYGKDKYGQIYIDLMQRKGTGFGIRHNYMLDSVTGSIYYYGINEQDTGRYGHSFQFKNTFPIDDYWTVSENITSTSIYRIDGSRQNDDTKAFGIGYTNVGEKHLWNYSNRSDYAQQIFTDTFGYSSFFNNPLPVFQFQYRKEQRPATRYLNETTSLTQSLLFLDDLNFTNNSRYERTSSVFSPLADEIFATQLTFRKPILDQTWFAALNLAYTLDPDNNTVTTDRTISFVDKSPEFVFTSKSVDFWALNFTQSFIVGHYREVKYQPEVDKVRDFSTERFGSITQARGYFSNLPLNSNFQTQHDYYQYGYTPGDVLVGIGQSYTFNSALTPFLQNSARYIDNDTLGNSPFFFDQNIFSGRSRQFKDTATLFWDSTTKYWWSHSTGWDYVKSKRLDYQTELGIQPDRTFGITAQTGYKFPESRLFPTDIFYNLSLSAKYTPAQNYSSELNLSYDLNNGQIQRLTDRTVWRFGENTWESRVDKIIFTIKAFPDDSIGLSTSVNEPFKFEGLFNAPAVNR